MIAMQHAGFPEHSSEFLLVRGQPIAIRAEAGDTLHVFSGVIWMTDGSATDYILHAGELFRFARKSLVVVQACQEKEAAPNLTPSKRLQPK